MSSCDFFSGHEWTLAGNAGFGWAGEGDLLAAEGEENGSADSGDLTVDDLTQIRHNNNVNNRERVRTSKTKLFVSLFPVNKWSDKEGDIKSKSTSSPQFKSHERP